MANVSVSTVSKAFSGAEDIGADTRELIFKIAKEAGCYGKFYKGKYDKKIAVKADGKCKNSHCILTTEQELEPKFFVDGNGDLRCFYCDGKIE